MRTLEELSICPDRENRAKGEEPMRMKHGSGRGPATSAKPRLLAAFTAVAMMFATAVPALMPKAANADDGLANGSICVPEDKPLGDDTSNAEQDNGIATWVGKDMYIGYPSAGVKANYGNGGNTPGQSYAVEAEGATLVGGRLAIHSVKNSWGANYGPNGVNYSGRGFRFGIVGFGGQFRPTEGDALVIAGSNSQMSGMVDKDGNAVNVLGWNDHDNIPGRGRGWIGANKEGEPNYTAKIAGDKSAAMGLQNLTPGSSYPGPTWSWTSIYNKDQENKVQWEESNPLASVNISGTTGDRSDFGKTITTQSDQLAALTPNGTYTTTTSSQSNYKRTKYNSGEVSIYDSNRDIKTRTIIEATFNVDERVIKFTGDGTSKLQVFNLPATELRNDGKGGVSFAFEKIPTGASIVINVTGEENIEFNNGWRFWWAGDKEIGNNWNQYEIGNGYSLYDNTSEAKQKAYVAAMSAIMWNFNKTASLTIKGGQASNASITAKKEYKWPTGVWYDGANDKFPTGNYSGTASVSDDPAAAMLGSIMMPNDNGAFDDHVTTNGRVWVNGNFYMNNPTKAYHFGPNVGEGDSASIIDMDQERHNKGWNATVKTNCPTISWEKVDGDGNVISGLPDGSTLASFQVFGSKDDAVNNRNVLVTVTDNQPLVDQDQAQGKFQIQDLGKNATYYIKEITAPTGYVPSANIYRIVTGNSDSETYSTIDKVYTAQGIEITNADGKDLSGTSGIVNKSGGADVEWGKYAEGDASYAGLSGSEWTLTRTDAEPKQEWTIRDYTAQVTGVEILHDGIVTQSLELTTGSHAQLSANVLPVGEAIQDVRWSSSNPGLVSVSPTGEVVVLRNTADNEDPNVTITAQSVSDPTKQAQITIVCKRVAVQSVTIQMNGSDVEQVSLQEGETKQLTAKTDPAGVGVEWSSSDSSVVEVDANGQLTAKKAGSATIAANAGDKNDTVTVTVKAKPVRTSTDVYVKWTDRSQARLYYWNDTTNNNPFPGTAMQKVQCGSDSWWKFSVPLTGTFKVIVTGNNDNDKYPANGNPGTKDIPIPGTAASYYIDGWYAAVTEGTPSGCSVRSAAPVRAQAVPSVEPVMDVSDDAAPQAEEATDPSAPHDVDPRVGRFKIENLPDGTYTLKEFKAPTGYWLNTTEYGFTVKNGELTWTAGKEPDVHDNEHWISDKPTQVAWEKVDGTTNKALAGSGWTIEQKTGDGENDWKPINEVVDCTNAPCNASVTYKDEDPAPGKFLVKQLPVGVYRITETTIPQGYEAIGGPYEFTITDSEKTVHVTSNPIGNTRKTGNVYWGKVNSEDDTSYLAGSEWQIKYTPYDGGDTITVTITDCVVADSKTTGTCAKEEGKPDWAYDAYTAAGRIGFHNLPWGSYEMIETKAPDGYYADPDAVYVFTVGPDTLEFQNVVIYKKNADGTTGGPIPAPTTPLPNYPNQVITNEPGVVLPATGGEGNTLIVLFGFALIAISMVGCGVAMRKRI